MNSEREFDEFCIKKEREKSDHDRWIQFEHNLRFLLCELKGKTDREDDLLMNNINQAVIVFAMKDIFGENNEIFLGNMKNDFYNAIQKLEQKHPEVQTFYIKLFMEDFYFNK